ncbi:MAG TPA: response regulator transcription factor, partial [Rhodothermales bacterium]
MLNVFLVDDHAFLRESLRELLNWERDIFVCGEAGSAAEALQNVDASNADVVLLDASLPDSNGIDLIPTLMSLAPDVHVAVLSGLSEPSHVERALLLGARGYIVKGYSEEIPGAIRAIASGGYFVSDAV